MAEEHRDVRLRIAAASGVDVAGLTLPLKHALNETVNIASNENCNISRVGWYRQFWKYVASIDCWISVARNAAPCFLTRVGQLEDSRPSPHAWAFGAHLSVHPKTILVPGPANMET
jgi:hypothetical protein